MKKFIATLLSLSLILACAACSKEEETTKKKKKKTSKTEKTESTEAPTDDPTEPDDSTTEKPTEDTDPSESDTSTSADSSPSATSPQPSLPSSFSYNRDQTALDLELEREDYIYGVEDTTSNDYYGRTLSVRLDCDTIWLFFDSAEHADMEGIIDDIYWDLEEKLEDRYDDLVEKLVEDAQNGVYPEYNESITCRTNVTRADSYILSFYITESAEVSGEKSTITAYNFITSTASTISLDDVVTDRDALYDYVANNMDDADLAYSKDLVLSQIKDGSIPFCLTYDGIVLAIPNTYSSDSAKISAIANEGLFNMAYFGSTPESFMFKAAHDGRIYWDVNGDNVTDEITITYPEDVYYYFEEMTFDINGTSTTITGDQSSDLEGSYEEAYLICQEGNYYILVTTTIEDDYSLELLFSIGSDLSVKFQGRFDGYFFNEPYTPENVTIADVSQFIGTGAKYDHYYLNPYSGTFELSSTISMRYGSVLITKKDIVGKDVFGDQDMPVPAGTPVRLFAYDTDSHFAYFETLHEDDWDNEIFALTFTEQDYRYVLDAGEETELFTGLFYAG